VKELGARMVVDHDRLTKLSSPGFDKAYLEAMAKDHEQGSRSFGA